MPFRSFNDLVAESKRTVTEIDCDELADLLDPQNDIPELRILDVREAEERSRGYIAQSIPLPRGILERDLAKAAFDGKVTDEHLGQPIVVYCKGGSRSALAAASLLSMGFTNVQSLAGGFDAWGQSGRPIEHPRSR
jgi:rhodanese-related sulfurtransferase